MERFVGEDKALVEKFLNGMYGGRTSSRRKFMVPESGVDLGIMGEDVVGKTPLFEEEVSGVLLLPLSFSNFEELTC